MQRAAHIWQASFNVQLYDGERVAAATTIRAWAQLTPAAAAEFASILDSEVEMGEMRNIAAVFGWSEWLENHLSAGVRATITALDRAPAPREGLGAYDMAGAKLTRCGRTQPTIGRDIGKLIDQGGPIARPEFYRASACMLSLFLETWHERITVKRAELTLAGLYKMATGLELPPDGEPAGVSLRECEVWLRHWRLNGRAINVRGELIWKYDHDSPNRHLAGGWTWNLLVHDQHVWSIARGTPEKAFARGIVTKGPQVVPFGRDLVVSDRWHWPPAVESDAVPGVVRSLEDIVAADCAQCITNEDPERLAIAAWEAGYEPGGIRLKHGTVDSFAVRVEGRLVRVGRAIDGDVRDDQMISSALTARTQAVFATALDRLRAAYQPRDGLSTYSASLSLGAAFRNYPRGPRCGRLGLVGESDTADCANYAEIDVCRAYTSLLAQCKTIPVFSSFDELRRSCSRSDTTWCRAARSCMRNLAGLTLRFWLRLFRAAPSRPAAPRCFAHSTMTPTSATSLARRLRTSYTASATRGRSALSVLSVSSTAMRRRRVAGTCWRSALVGSASSRRPESCARATCPSAASSSMVCAAYSTGSSRHCRLPTSRRLPSGPMRRTCAAPMRLRLGLRS